MVGHRGILGVKTGEKTTARVICVRCTNAATDRVRGGGGGVVYYKGLSYYPSQAHETPIFISGR